MKRNTIKYILANLHKKNNMKISFTHQNVSCDKRFALTIGVALRAFFTASRFII